MGPTKLLCYFGVIFLAILLVNTVHGAPSHDSDEELVEEVEMEFESESMEDSEAKREIELNSDEKTESEFVAPTEENPEVYEDVVSETAQEMPEYANPEENEETEVGDGEIQWEEQEEQEEQEDGERDEKPDNIGNENDEELEENSSPADSEFVQSMVDKAKETIDKVKTAMSYFGEHQSSPAITNSEPDPYNPDPVETPAAA